YSWLSAGFEDRSSNRFEIPTNFILKFKFEHEEFPLLMAKFGSNSQTVEVPNFSLIKKRSRDVSAICARWSTAFHTFVTAWREFTFTLEDLCGKAGHVVDRCYYRFDSSYKSNNFRPPPQANFCMISPGSSIVQWSPPTQQNVSGSPTVQWSPPTQQNVQWYPPGWCFSTPSTSVWPHVFAGSTSPQVNMQSPGAVQSQAYVATPETVADNSWYPDSGATHHLTNSASSLTDSEAYKG
ncbi:hypothetical protein Golob_003919, partial [Gossypium lobatum]|nr:hypothetical protein [Gossypium lobatum]